MNLMVIFLLSSNFKILFLHSSLISNFSLLSFNSLFFFFFFISNSKPLFSRDFLLFYFFYVFQFLIPSPTQNHCLLKSKWHLLIFGFCFNLLFSLKIIWDLGFGFVIWFWLWILDLNYLLLMFNGWSLWTKQNDKYKKCEINIYNYCTQKHETNTCE